MTQKSTEPRSTPKASIGMPVYNGERYIRDALESLLAQIFTDFELIISDNASTDNTEQICREYLERDTRIRYIRQPTNRGAAANFQFVLDEAAGEYFMWAACDDLWRPNFLAHALSSLSAPKNELAGFAFPTFLVKSINLKIFKKFASDIYRDFEHEDKRQRVLGFANLHQSSYKGNLVYSVFRTDLIKKAYSVQDITDEYILSMVLLSWSRCVVLKEYDFVKRYIGLWPGFRKKRLLSARKVALFEQARDKHSMKAKAAFPEYAEILELIRKGHRPSVYHSRYKILTKLPE